MGRPRSSRDPERNRGSQAAERIGSVPARLIVLSDPRAANGPATSHPCTKWIATQLSRMVEMTSCTPRHVLRRPAMNAHAAPAIAEASSAAGMSNGPGASRARPTTAAASAPQMSCPSPPMLNSPTVNATATERPVRTSTPVLMAVSPSGPRPPRAPWKSCANPATGSFPATRITRKAANRDASAPSAADQSGSRPGVKSRSRSVMQPRRA